METTNSPVVEKRNIFVRCLMAIGHGFLLFLPWLRDLLGLGRHDRYVRDHIALTNVRSGVFMGAIIAILEVWLFFRQLDKYIIPQWDTLGPSSILLYTSTFILFFLIGLSMTVFCLLYESKKVSAKVRLVLNLVFAGAVILYCLRGFFEPYSEFDTTRHVVSNVTWMLLYILAFLTAFAMIVEELFAYLKPKNRMWFANIVIILFALMCFAFGVKVSYSDYTSSNQKQILCFLTMVIYGSCLLIWRPFISILVNTALFVGFYFMIVDAGEVAGTTFNDGDLVNYITFLVAFTAICVSIYHQRLKEAKKSSNLEYIAHYDEMTGLLNYTTFSKNVSEYLTVNPDKAPSHILIFTNLSNFKIFNDRRGFAEGNHFLFLVARELEDIFKGDLLCHQSDDHFVIYTETEGLDIKLAELAERIIELDPELSIRIKYGGYAPRADEEIYSAADKARYACSLLRSDHNRDFLVYDEDMEKEYALIQYVIHQLERDMANGAIRPYYQPVVWSEDRTLCGVEALCRWISPEHGFISPGFFIPVLESIKLCYKLDAHILREVCRDLRARIDKGLPVVPVSVNFSRRDFSALDVAALLDETLTTYGIDKSLIHVEVTESALTDSKSRLAETLARLKNNGYALWLDDFGSGYSSLNTLKDFRFDVMKIDLKFLENFDTSEKARPLIDSVIQMATKLGMRTLCEGVETEAQEEFLREAGCERMQGYLFGKAYPLEELNAKILKNEIKVSSHLL